MFSNSHALSDQLSWTHYRYILKVNDKNERDFYVKECIENQWSTRQLERQINSFYYERLLSSQEKDLEQSLIDNLQDFLLELGKGFTFEKRQKRITIL